MLSSGEETRKMRELFLLSKDNPPLGRSRPRVAGSILWSRSILHRLKQPILAFRNTPQLLDSSEGQAISKQYLHFGKELVQYETDLFQSWVEDASVAVGECLMNNILVKEELLKSLPEGGRGGARRRWVYRVNFCPEMWLIIREARYLDQMGGFELPQTIMNVALQKVRTH
eukprot:GHVQ01042147.1.p2 GENE.GHVQ01042147.1~~GHVQ01042147.1.p2  ORF type:complete len:171 (+),score=11.43 GHVQ01042147.1:598-1110(+)